MGRPTDKNLKNTKSSPDKAATYKGGRRYGRLQERRKARIAIAQAKVPQIFGDHTYALMLLARHGPVRRCELQRVLSMSQLDRLIETDTTGLFVEWPLPFRDGCQRGYAVSLNPDFPLIREVKALARKLFECYPIPDITTDIKSDEARQPGLAKRRHSSDDMLFGYPTRTALLAALEVLGGSARYAELRHGVPNITDAGAQAAIIKAVQLGFLKRANGTISFPDLQWVPQLRTLLRAFLRLRPEFAISAKARLNSFIEVRSDRGKYAILGRAAMERAIIALAINGTMTEAQLMELARTSQDKHGLDYLKAMGIVATIKDSRRSRLIGLNTRHPLYKKLHRFILVYYGKDPNPTSWPKGLSVPLPSYGYDKLFATSVRLDVMVHVAIAKHGEIDAASIGCLVDHSPRNIQSALKYFERLGFLVHRWGRGYIKRYRFNSKAQGAGQLRALLRKIADMDPHYRNLAKLIDRLQVDHRQAIERNHRRKDRLEKKKKALKKKR